MFATLLRHFRRIAKPRPLKERVEERLRDADARYIQSLLTENARLNSLISDQDKKLASRDRTIESLKIAVGSDEPDGLGEAHIKTVEDLRLALAANRLEMSKLRDYVAILERDEFGRLMFFKDLRTNPNGVQTQ